MNRYPLAAAVGALIVTLAGVLLEARHSSRSPTDCGRYTVAFRPDQHDDDKRQCLVRAFERGTRARLEVAELTIEGDPVMHVYNVVGRRLFEYRIDTTQDSFGHPGVYQYRCRSLAIRWSSLTVGECDGRPAP